MAQLSHFDSELDTRDVHHEIGTPALSRLTQISEIQFPERPPKVAFGLFKGDSNNGYSHP